MIDKNILETGTLPELALRVRQLVQKCQASDVRSVAVYGAGSHTKLLLPLLSKYSTLEVTRILVTGKPTERAYEGIPLISLDDFEPHSADAVVLSSHAYEPEMFYSLKCRYFNVPVYPIWNAEQDFELYDKLKRLLGSVAHTCRVEGIRSVAVFGAGSHTQLLLPMWAGLNGPEVKAIIVSDPPKTSDLLGLPVIEAAHFDPSHVGAILLSSRSFEREMYRTCLKHWPHVPVYPVWDAYEEPLVNRLRKRIPATIHKCAVHNARSVAVYGAGVHTRMLLPHWRESGGPEIRAIVVTNPPVEKELMGIAMVAADEFDPATVDAIVLSSSTYELEMHENCKRLWPDLNVFPVWDFALSRRTPGNSQSLSSKTAYEQWYYRNRLTPKMRVRLSEELSRLKENPKFSFVVPVYNTPSDFLAQALDSLRAQIYQNWEACLIDDGSTLAGIDDTLRRHSEADARIRYRRLENNQGIVRATNEAIQMVRGNYLIPVDHDDLLEPDALLQIAKYLELHPDTDVLYTDNDKISDDNRLLGPEFKPAWSPELMYSWCYPYHVKVFSRRVVDEIGLMDPQYECAQDYEFFLRAAERARKVGHLPLVLYHHRILHGQSSRTRASQENGRKAVEASVVRQGFDWVHVQQPGFARATANGLYQLALGQSRKESVSVILDSSPDPAKTAECLVSLLANAQVKDRLQVILASAHPLDERAQTECKRIHQSVEFVFPREGETLNWSTLANKAAEIASGEYLAFVDGRNRISGPNWIEGLLVYARMAEIGVVGCRVLDSKGKVIHAGLVKGFNHGLIGYACRRLDREDSGYMHFARVARNCAAVTHDCMMIRKSLFQRLGGFDLSIEGELADADLCLRSENQEFRTVCTPSVEVIRSATRETTPHAFQSALNFRRRWNGHSDRYYNPNLTSWGEQTFLVAPEKNNRLAQFDSARKQIKVLSVSHNLNYEGAPYVKLKLDLFLADQGITLDVISAEDGPLRTNYEERGIGVTILDCPFDASLAQYQALRDRLRDRIRECKYDVVFVNTLMLYWAIDAAHAAGVPCIWNIHESIDYHEFYEARIPDPAVRAAAQSAICRANRLVFVCRATAQMFAAYDKFGVTEVIYNGIDASRFAPAGKKEKRALRTKLGLPKLGKLVTIVGTVCPRKGQLDFVRCASELIKEGSQDCFAVVGTREAPYLAHYLKEVKQIAAQHPNRILLVPETPAQDYLRASDVLVCASYEESFPMVILEAMSCGVPIVTTPVYGIAEQISNGSTGLFFEPGNTLQMGNGIKQIVTDSGLAADLGRNAREAVSALFKESEMTAGYYRMVHQVSAEDVNDPAWLSSDTKLDLNAPRSTNTASDPAQPRPLATDLRSLIAAKYISGEGIEIGALHNPIAVPAAVKVKYVDRLAEPGLRKQYPELAKCALVHVDIVDNGETLSRVADESQDFVIANHFLEHCQNPILALENMTRVLKVGGIVLLAIPDKRFTFDVRRPVTSFDHLIKDYRQGPGWSRRSHFEEWVREVHEVREPGALQKKVQELLDIDYSIHFHVWTQAEALELMSKLMPLFHYDVEQVSRQGNEVIFVLRKTESKAQQELAERATA